MIQKHLAMYQLKIHLCNLQITRKKEVITFNTDMHNQTIDENYVDQLNQSQLNTSQYDRYVATDYVEGAMNQSGYYGHPDD